MTENTSNDLQSINKFFISNQILNSQQKTPKNGGGGIHFKGLITDYQEV